MFYTPTVTKLPTIKALKELCYMSEKQLNALFDIDSMDYAILFRVLKRLNDNGYEYGYSEILYGLYYGVMTGRISSNGYHKAKTMTNKQIFKEIVLPCAKALKASDKNFCSGFAWDWMRDNYFVQF
jgi:hypothetical protein